MILGMCLLISGAAVSQAPDPLALERSAVQARCRILSGEFKMDVRRSARGIARYRIIFDEENLRFECIRHPPASTIGAVDDPHEDLQRARERRIESGFYLIITPSLVAERAAFKGVGLATDTVTLYNYDSFQTADRSLRTAVFDPRVIGMTPEMFEHLHQSKLSAVLTRSDRVATKISAETLDGTKCWKISYLRNDGVNIRLWISPTEGDSLVYAESETLHKGQTILDSVACQMARSKASNVWFPETVTWRRRVDGDDLATEEARIYDCKLNVQPNKQLFTLAGFGIPSGTHVLDKRTAVHPQPMLWNGRDLEPLRVVLPPREFLSASPGGRAFVNLAVYFLVSAGLVLLIVFAWRHKLNR
jgi:hypothetical protein